MYFVDKLDTSRARLVNRIYCDEKFFFFFHSVVDEEIFEDFSSHAPNGSVKLNDEEIKTTHTAD